MRAGKLPDQVEIAQDQVGLGGNADADPGSQKLLEQSAGATVFRLQRLIADDAGSSRKMEEAKK